MADLQRLTESELWGWESFFDETAKFLRESGHQFGNCSETYASHALERLETCITNVSRLTDHLQDGLQLVEPESLDIVTK